MNFEEAAARMGELIDQSVAMSEALGPPPASAGGIDALRVRRVMGRKEWMPPEEVPSVCRNGQFAPMWKLDRYDMCGRILLSVDAWDDGHEWIHASMSMGRLDRVPSYEELKLLHRAVFGDGWAYHVFAPAAQHVNDHEFCLHLWGRLDGSPALPNFAIFGSV